MNVFIHIGLRKRLTSLSILFLETRASVKQHIFLIVMHSALYCTEELNGSISDCLVYTVENRTKKITWTIGMRGRLLYY